MASLANKPILRLQVSALTAELPRHHPPSPLPGSSVFRSFQMESCLPRSSCQPASPCPARGWAALDTSRRCGLGAALAQLSRVRACILRSAFGAPGRAVTPPHLPSLSICLVWSPDPGQPRSAALNAAHQ